MNDLDRARESQIARGLEQAKKRVVAACQTFGRVNVDGKEPVTLIVVTKTHPATDVEILRHLGVHHVGENRDQEARAKSELSPPDLTWHMIGQIQRNKINSIARWADVIHTCDRSDLVNPLSRAAETHGKLLDVLIQVNLDPQAPANRGGALPQELLPLAEHVNAAVGLTLRGLMAVAPHPSTGIDPGSAFKRLAGLSAALVQEFPHATEISAGMSEDLEAAIEHGATHVRLGSAILGARPTVQ